MFTLLVLYNVGSVSLFFSQITEPTGEPLSAAHSLRSPIPLPGAPIHQFCSTQTIIFLLPQFREFHTCPYIFQNKQLELFCWESFGTDFLNIFTQSQHAEICSLYMISMCMKKEIK